MSMNIEMAHTERALERGVSPLVKGALSLLISPLVWGFVSSVACGVMSERSKEYAVVCCKC
jgi:hypothetical protein